jgi:hypothetical protein
MLLFPNIDKHGVQEGGKIFSINTSIDKIRASIKNFSEYVKNNPDITFYVTEEFFEGAKALKGANNNIIWKQFRREYLPENVLFTEKSDPRLADSSHYDSEAGILTLNFSVKSNNSLIRIDSLRNGRKVYPHFIVGTEKVKNKTITTLFQKLGGQEVYSKGGKLKPMQIKYERVTELGTQHFLLEFDLNNDIKIEDSVRNKLLSTKKLPKAPTVSSGIPDEALLAAYEAKEFIDEPTVVVPKKEVKKQPASAAPGYLPKSLGEYNAAVEKYNKIAPGLGLPPAMPIGDETSLKKKVERDPAKYAEIMRMAKNC